MKRSQSAPQGLPTLVQAKADIPRSSSHAQLGGLVASPVAEREDPFSMQGFFPRSLDTREWTWLRDEGWGKTDDTPGTAADGTERMTEKDVKQILQTEDKTGLVALLEKYGM